MPCSGSPCFSPTPPSWVPHGVPWFSFPQYTICMNSLILSPSERASQPNAGPSCSKSPVASSRARSRAGFFAITYPWGFTDFPGQVALVAPEESFRPSGYYFFFAKRQVTSLRCIGLAFSRLKVLVLLIIIHQSRSLSGAGGAACKQEEQMTAQ